MKTKKEILLEKIEELKKEIEEIDKKNDLNWRVKNGERYWCITTNGEIASLNDTDHFYDDYRWETGNYFKTEVEAEVYKDRQLAVGRINRRINELNAGWIPNWKDIDEKKWNIYKLSPYLEYMSSYTSDYQECLLLNYCKTEEITEQIIKGHKEDLDLIFNFKQL